MKNGERICLVGTADGSGDCAAASRQLAARGYELITPYDPGCCDSAAGMRAALGAALDAVLEADLLVLLPGWETSPTARILVLTAFSQGIHSVPVGDLLSAA